MAKKDISKKEINNNIIDDSIITNITNSNEKSTIDKKSKLSKKTKTTKSKTTSNQIKNNQISKSKTNIKKTKTTKSKNENHNSLLDDNIDKKLLEDDVPKNENLTTKEKRRLYKRLRSKSEMTTGIIRYRPKAEKGLTNEQVAERNNSGLLNISIDKKNKSVIGIIAVNTFTFFNMIYLLVCLALLYVNAYADLFFVVIVVANTTISIIQEIKAKNIIEKIKLNNNVFSKVMRNGTLENLPKENIVLDDIIFLTIGMQIPADCIVQTNTVEVNEALLTGESLPIKKSKGEILLAGSFVSSGSCYARVENIGKENYIEKLSSRAKKYSKPKSQLLYSLKIIIRSVAIIIIPIAYFMFINNYSASGNDIYEAIPTTAGSIIGMIPAGMFLLTTMALAVGVIRLAKKRTLVQELYCIEMLARANVLCLDKTGTLTDGSMKVADIISLKTISGEKNIDNIMKAILSDGSASNQTSIALTNHFGINTTLNVSKFHPFSSEKKCSGITLSGGGIYKIGAAEYVLPKPSASVQKIIDEQSRNGLRVIVLVSSSSFDSSNVTPLAIITLEDNIRKDAPETIKWFKDNGVNIKVISGDNPLTVSEIARRVGIDGYDKYISLQNMTKDDVIRASKKYTVFGRVSPEQKAILIKALKVAGNTVAMTGDGVNDILALKEADCSIAVAAGSEAARSVSHLVLLDSDFSSMPNVVAEGRRVINNVQKSSSLFLMKTIMVLIVSIFVLIYNKSYPFTPIQFLLLEMFVIGVPSFFLALQPNKNIIKGNFLANVFNNSLPAGLVLSINVMLIYFYQDLVGFDQSVLITLSSVAVTIVGLLALFDLCKPFNLYKSILFVASILIIAILLFALPALFGYVALSLEQLFFLLVIIQASYPLYMLFKKAITSIKIGE